MGGRRVRRDDAAKVRSRQILQGLVSYFKEFDLYAKVIEEPEQDLKEREGKFAFSKDISNCSVNKVLEGSNNGGGDQPQVSPKSQVSDN